MGAKANALMQAIHGTDVYAGLDPVLPFDLQGWNSSHPVFKEIISNDRPSVIFDVGVWKGGSTIAIAKLVREIGNDGVIVAIDTFLGSPEHWDTTGDYGNFVLRKNGRPLLYEQFLTNVLIAGFQDLIIPLPQTSENAAAILMRLGISAKLIHIDAAHEYESVKRDVRLYWNLLDRGGYLIGDDYPSWPGVVRAVNEFAETIGQPLTIREPKWLIKKPEVVTKATTISDLPRLPESSSAANRWDLIEGLNAEVFQGSAVVSGQHILRLVAVGADRRHALGVRFDNLAPSAIHRAAAWVKAEPGIHLMIEARDSVDPNTGKPANYGIARFDFAARSVISSNGDILASGVETAVHDWVKVWVDLRSRDGRIFALIGLLEGSNNRHVFTPADQSVIFGGFDISPSTV